MNNIDRNGKSWYNEMDELRTDYNRGTASEKGEKV